MPCKLSCRAAISLCCLVIVSSSCLSRCRSSLSPCCSICSHTRGPSTSWLREALLQPQGILQDHRLLTMSYLHGSSCQINTDILLLAQHASRRSTRFWMLVAQAEDLVHAMALLDVVCGHQGLRRSLHLRGRFESTNFSHARHISLQLRQQVCNRAYRREWSLKESQSCR